MSRILGQWKRLSILQKLYVVVGTMAVLIVCELVILRVAMEQVSAVRAFVEGEALWSKSQKNALLELKRFQRTRDEKSYQAYLNYLVVPEGNHIARLELMKTHPNLSVVKAGFIQGRIHPDDIDRMVFMLRRLHWISYVSQAITDWTHADMLLQEVKTAANLLHDSVLANDNDASLRFLDRINEINAELNPVEDHFSSILGEGSRWLESKVLSLFILMVIIVEATGLTLTVLTGREISGIAMENARLYREAQEAITTRDDFMSIASHELKTPLTSLSLQIHMARQKTSPGSKIVLSSEKIAKIFSDSGKQVDRLAGLVEELMDVSRIQTGKFSFNFEEVSLSEIVIEMVNRKTAEFDRAKILATTHIEENIVGNFDQMRIGQAVDNLLSNAIKYASGNPITISAKRYQSNARLSFEDNGPGIPHEKQERIFERFERATASNNVSGLGLGLFIVKEIVLGHKGSIHVESVMGKGSNFIMDLPLDCAPDTYEEFRNET